MVRALKTILLLALASCLLPTTAFAQGGANEGDMAVSGNLGFANAIEDDFEGLEPFFNGTFEYYFTEEFSLRGLFGFTSFDHDFGDVDVTLFSANAMWYWNTGDIQPFVTGGLGLYDLDIDVDPPGPGRFSESDLELGVNGGGGVDFMIQDNWAIKVEGLLHAIAGDGPDAAFTLTGGVKWRF